METPRKLIEIVVEPDGAASLETRGFAGGECKAASAAYEAALGTVTADAPTPEALRPAPLAAEAAARARTALG